MTKAAPDFLSINRRFTRQVVSAIGDASAESAVIVEAPPGAGKSTLTCSVANALVKADTALTLPIVTQTNEQADDIVDAFHARYPKVRIGRLTSGAGPSPAITNLMAGSSSVVAGTQVRQGALRDARVVVGTARKWQYERDRLERIGGHFDVGLIDEAYQMRSDLLLGISSLFDRLLCVGDPGQLDPFTEVDDGLWRGLPYSPVRPAVAVLRANFENLAPIQLPTSWRLPPSAADIVSRAFYPFSGFNAGTSESQRSISFTPRRGQSHSFDGGPALARAAADGWAFVELPEKFTNRADAQIAETLAAITTQALQRGATVVDEREPSGHALTGARIAVVAAHNDQVQAIRYYLNALGTDPDSVVVSTANKIQGREYDLTLVWHPLAGRRDATAFHLEAGRMCVMLSRHRQACVVVGRSGAERLLSEFPDSDPIFLDEPEKFPDGWQANYEVLEHLRSYRV